MLSLQQESQRRSCLVGSIPVPRRDLSERGSPRSREDRDSSAQTVYLGQEPRTRQWGSGQWDQEGRHCWCHLVAESRLTLCDTMDCSLPGSAVHGISQARILEWVAISFSRVSSQPRDQICVSCLAGRFFTTEPPRKPVVDINSALSRPLPYRTTELPRWGALEMVWTCLRVILRELRDWPSNFGQ